MNNRIKLFGFENHDISEVNFQELRSWLFTVAETHEADISKLDYHFLTDDELLKINIDFLDHNFYTDIITFPYSSKTGIVKGEIFISVDRIRDNANRLIIPFQDEFYRVCVHGLLHLLGMDDSTEEQKKAMRAAEDKALILRTL